MTATENTQDYVLFEKIGRIGYVTLNRPGAMNALCWPLMERLEFLLKQAEKDPDVRVIVIRGEGKCFSAGYDFKETDPTHMGPGVGPADGTHEPRGVPAYGRGVWNSRAHVQGHIHFDQLIWGLWKPVIAQVHGVALAGASTLALACDLTIMAEDAKIGYPPTRWLASGDNIGIYSFAAGLKKARELSFGRMLNGKEAVQSGMANYCYPEADLAAETLRIANEIAEIDSELLMLNKMVVNRTWEIMGIRTAMEVSGEFDTMCHLANTGSPLRNALVKHGNLTGAIEEINRPWGGL